MTKPKSATSPPVLILYGLDTDGRPRAAVFNAAQADLATKAAESLELQVLRIETAEQIDLARQVPSGEILAPGRGNVPVVRKELFDKLLALVPAPGSGPSQEAASAAEVDAVPSATTTDNSEPASKAPPPKQPPTTWAEIDVGDLVLAENWDPEKLMELYKRAGAQYFFALANHHDNFDNRDSKYQPWNSVAVGPHKDLIGGWAKAARKNGLRALSIPSAAPVLQSRSHCLKVSLSQSLTILTCLT